MRKRAFPKLKVALPQLPCIQSVCKGVRKIYMLKRLSLRGLSVGCIGAVLMALPASATLGESASTVTSDAQHLRASARLTQGSGYEVHEMQSGSATVREYVSDGKVFAVSWQGSARPDLKQLLGSYYPQLQAAVAADKMQHAGRHPVSIKQGDLVIQMGGHQRAFVGRAYVRSMMPASMKAAEIR